jgi:hypothetical protein
MSVRDALRGLDQEELSGDQRRQVRFVLEVVDLLAERYGFDPAQLANARTGESLAAALARMRDAVDEGAVGP